MNICEVIGEFLLDNWEKIGILVAILFKSEKKSKEEKLQNELDKQHAKNLKTEKKLKNGYQKEAELEKEIKNAKSNNET